MYALLCAKTLFDKNYALQFSKLHFPYSHEEGEKSYAISFVFLYLLLVSVFG